MAAVTLHTPEPSVIVEGDAVLIQSFDEHDPEFVALVLQADNPEQTTHDCLSVGARALRSVETTVDVAVVDKRFGEFETRLEHGTRETVRQIAAASAGYLDPEQGELKKMLDGMRAELGQTLDKSLGATFDPKSKESVLAKFEAVFAVGTRELGKSVRDLVDPGNPESPLGRLRAEMGGALTEVRKALDELAKQVAVARAAELASAEVLELTAVKGRRFEEVVFDAVAEFVALYGDMPEAVGDSYGGDGNRVGDILVTLNEDDAPAGAAYVVEAKDRKRLSLREALDELDRALDNRQAQAGVIVFAGPEKTPIAAPCRAYGNKVVVVLDKSDPDTQPLRLALMASRLAVQRQMNGGAGELDHDGALALIEEGQRALACHATIKRCHGAARKQIDGAATHTDALVQRVEVILSELARKLRC